MSDDQRALSLLPTYRLLCPPLNTLLTISALSHMKQIQQEAKNRLFSERISTIPLFPQQTLPGRGAETLRTPPRQCGVKLRLPAATERGGGAARPARALSGVSQTVVGGTSGAAHGQVRVLSEPNDSLLPSWTCTWMGWGCCSAWKQLFTVLLYRHKKSMSSGLAFFPQTGHSKSALLITGAGALFKGEKYAVKIRESQVNLEIEGRGPEDPKNLS